ncbi:E3 ubiquitin-protein ligase MIB2-like [Corticium candelabrum]|uniref:E3 ubiquitin-protein ligase MIB2-like n=1 Tax=Corticium candelabrum TaxID=121492 RepID=UPI002E2720E9|nr:E3 ubiquitin-protein ligase MIB2-like [Corticium candelabrum]
MAESQPSTFDDALFDAVVQKNLPIAARMIGMSADVNVVAKREGTYGTGLYGFPSALQVACGVGSTELVELLVRKLANVKYQEKGKYGYTALHYASAGGHVSILKRLMSAGCNQQVKSHVSVFVCDSICDLILPIEK